MTYGKFYRLDLEVTHIIYAHIPPGTISHVIIPNCKGGWEIESSCVYVHEEEETDEQQAVSQSKSGPPIPMDHPKIVEDSTENNGPSSS